MSLILGVPFLILISPSAWRSGAGRFLMVIWVLGLGLGLMNVLSDGRLGLRFIYWRKNPSQRHEPGPRRSIEERRIELDRMLMDERISEAEHEVFRREIDDELNFYQEEG